MGREFNDVPWTLPFMWSLGCNPFVEDLPSSRKQGSQRQALHPCIPDKPAPIRTVCIPTPATEWISHNATVGHTGIMTDPWVSQALGTFKGMSLLAASQDQPYMLLCGGFVDAPMGYFVKAEDRGLAVPALAFALRYSQMNQLVVFDLGIREDNSTCPPEIQKRMQDNFPVHVPQDVGDSLRRGGVSTEDIQTIILGHIHWDQYVLWRMFSIILFHILLQHRRFFPLPKCEIYCWRRDWRPLEGRLP